MANISLLSRLVNGVQRQVDLSTNTLVVGGLTSSGVVKVNTAVTADNLAQILAAAGSATNKPLVVQGAASQSAALTEWQSSNGTVLASVTSAGVFSGSGASLTSIPASSLTGQVAIANGGTGQATASAAFNALSPMTTLGDIIYGGTAGAGTRLGGNTATTRQFLLSSGTGSAANAPSWASLTSSDITTALTYTPVNRAGDTMTGFLTLNADPTSALHAATKQYVDNLAQGVSWKTIVRSATTAALPANTYANGTAGVGATLTGNANGALPAQDGVTLVVDDRILVKNEATTANNGIYIVTQVGSVGTPYILTRATDNDDASEFVGATVEIGTEASTQAKQIWFQSTAAPITVGTTAISWTQISSALVYNFRNGLTLTGTNVDVAPGDTSLTSTAGSLVVNLNAAGAIVTSTGLKINLESSNPTLQISTNQLGVKLDAARAITTGASGIGVNVDNTSIDIATNAIEIKAQGVTSAKVNTNVFDQASITGGNGSAAAVQWAPAMQFTEVAGQNFTSLNTTYAVRYGLPANSETAGRVYACDTTTSSFDLFWCIGFIQTAGASITAGSNVTVFREGIITLASADTAFGVNDPGKPIFLQAGGTNASTTAPSTAGLAVAQLGIVKTTTSFRISIGSPYVA